MAQDMMRLKPPAIRQVFPPPFAYIEVLVLVSKVKKKA